MFSLRAAAAAGGRCGWLWYAGHLLNSAVCEPLFMLLVMGALAVALALPVPLVLLFVGAFKVPAVEALLNITAD